MGSGRPNAKRHSGRLERRLCHRKSQSSYTEDERNDSIQSALLKGSPKRFSNGHDNNQSANQNERQATQIYKKVIAFCKGYRRPSGR
jgi:hypothetical protein